MSPDWPLMRRILALLAGEIGMSDAEIAERLEVPVADVRQAARILFRQHKVDFVQGYVVAIPSADGGRRSA